MADLVCASFKQIFENLAAMDDPSRSSSIRSVQISSKEFTLAPRSGSRDQKKALCVSRWTSGPSDAWRCGTGDHPPLGARSWRLAGRSRIGAGARRAACRIPTAPRMAGPVSIPWGVRQDMTEDGPRNGPDSPYQQYCVDPLKSCR